MKKKLISLFLAVLMVISLLPMTAFAGNDTTPDHTHSFTGDYRSNRDGTHSRKCTGCDMYGFGTDEYIEGIQGFEVCSADIAATCTRPVGCRKCYGGWGDIDPNSHSFTGDANYVGDHKHNFACKYGCGNFGTAEGGKGSSVDCTDTNPVDGKCDVCGYAMTPAAHVHSFDTAWTTSETAHWHKCTAKDCDIEDYATCGITEAAYGIHFYNRYKTDETNHPGQHAATCICGKEDEWVNHDFSSGNCVCGAEKPAPAHTHNDITFTAWTKQNKLPDEAGNYYLDTDVTLNETWNVPKVLTNLCLNGHTIKLVGGAEGSVINVPDGATLNLYDCGTNGKITGGNAGWGGGVNNSGTFTMHGGTITGNTTTTTGGGVCNDTTGIFIMSGGKITGNTATTNGGGVHTLGTFTMTGGEITGNTASTNGGGVNLQMGTATLGGTAKIIGNFQGTAANNLYLPWQKTVTIAEDPNAPAVGMSVGVTVYQPPFEGYSPQITTNGASTDTQYFTSDNADYEVQYNTSGYLELAVKTTPSHTHTPVLVNGQPATKEAAGWKDYYECDCDALFEDENGTTPIENLDTWKAEGGNGYLAPLPYTIGDILATVDDFPTAADDGWVNENGAGMYSDANQTLLFKDANNSGINEPYTTVVEKSGNNYVLHNSVWGYDITFVMTNNILVSVIASNVPIFTAVNGTYAPPAPTPYTVTFHMNGHGTQVAAQTVTEGGKATKPADPSASGYTFGGWYADEKLSVKFDFDTAITADTEVYAKWTKNSATPTNPTNPKTGDSSHIGLWVALLFVSGGALVGAVIYTKKKNTGR